MRDFFNRLLFGRYGNDQLNNALLLIGAALCILEWLSRWSWLTLPILALLALCYFRMFSRNIAARRSENQRFLNWWWPVSRRIGNARIRFADRKTYRFFKCPNCGKRLRVPKGRGRINITCPICRHCFIRKS